MWPFKRHKHDWRLETGKQVLGVSGICLLFGKLQLHPLFIRTYFCTSCRAVREETVCGHSD